MPRLLLDSCPRRLLSVLCEGLLIGMLVAPSPLPNGFVPGTHDFVEAHRPETERVDRAAPSLQEPSSSDYDESFVEQVLEVLLGAFILLPVLGLLFAFPSTLLAVSLVMDGGCLRYLLFFLGWIFSIFFGLLVGAIVGDAILGLDAVVGPIAHVFTWGYPAAAWWAHKKFQSMPREQYRAWDQTLTGGALLGFGAGSIAGLLRSVGSGFGGFGGGSFGGGGASGSWSGATSTTGSAQSGAAGSASTAAGTTATAAGSAAKATAVGAGAAPGTASDASSIPPSEASSSRGFWERLRRWFQKFQWYHGVIFVLVTLVFVPLGLGTMQALQNKEFLVFVLVCTVVYSGYRFLRRTPETAGSAGRSISPFQGGEASSSWS